MKGDPGKGEGTMEAKDYPKYQWSMFTNDRSEQIVVRAEHLEELVNAIRKIHDTPEFQAQVSGNGQAVPRSAAETQAAPAPAAAAPANQAPICGVHGVPMIWKTGVSQKTGEAYAFWACSKRNADGSFCKYKPPKQ